jgi:hypothetical protein
MDLPGPSACVGRDPLSHKAKGVLTGAWGDERHRSARAQSRRLGGPGRPSAASRLLLRVPWQLRARLQERGRAWLRGVPGVQETGRSAVSCTGLRGASREIAPSFHGFRCFGAESSSEQLQISRENEGATPKGRRGKSIPRMVRRRIRNWPLLTLETNQLTFFYSTRPHWR